VVCGDINIHLDRDNTAKLDFCKLLGNYGVQTDLINTPTHTHGHTIDFVGSTTEITPIVKDLAISDHFSVFFDLVFQAIPNKNHEKVNKPSYISVRKTKSIIISDFTSDLSTKFKESQDTGCVNTAANSYHSALQTVFDTHAPEMRVKRHKKHHINYSHETQLLKRQVRQQERKHLRLKLTVSRQILNKLRQQLSRSVRANQRVLFSKKIEMLDHGKQQSKLFDLVSSLTSPGMSNNKPVFPVPSDKMNLPESFAHFFNNKIESIVSGFPASHAR
jgi:hypothetical protein